ncbi:GDSL esterase/lipase [Canna indica]|uniref:GDSL esterase/lipase n=1 Tax=Canna indica TaxID=4628 RepID=A0AAQ3QRZ6_9LILI|nr:GDSL esterase/lipase [Canna indica]
MAIQKLNPSIQMTLCINSTLFFFHLLLCLTPSLVAAVSRVPALIIFGESIADPGNNNNIPTLLKSNFLSAYLEPGYDIKDLAKGVSFALAGTGLYKVAYDISHVIPLWKTVEFFKEYQEKLRSYAGEAMAVHIVGEAVLIDGGISVVLFYARVRRQKPESSASTSSSAGGSYMMKKRRRQRWRPTTASPSPE